MHHHCTLIIEYLEKYFFIQSKNSIPRRGEYNVYSTFQSHEPEFDYLKSLEIEEKINKIRWLKRKNPAHFLLSTNDKTIKLWKVSERDKRVEGYNTKEENGAIRDPACITALRVSLINAIEREMHFDPLKIVSKQCIVLFRCQP